MDNPRTFLDVEIDGEAAGKLVLTLYADVVPKTAENFRVLCTGEAGAGKRGKKLHFKCAASFANLPVRLELSHTSFSASS